MGLEVKLLDLGDIELESSFLVLGNDMGIRKDVPTFGYLITGGEAPIVIDTGFSHPEIMENLGMKGYYHGDQGMDKQLAKYGVSKADVGMILHTHLHIDHAGQDDQFSMDTPVVINRRELEYSVSGIMGEQYPAPYIKHLVDRLHEPGSLRLLDLEIAGPEQVAPGVWCEAAGGHTEGSMNVIVETEGGRVCICGDVIYDVHKQINEPWLQVMHMDMAVTGNQGTSKREEKAAIRKALNSGRFVCPIHDRPAVVEAGRVVGRVKEDLPGGEIIANEDYPGPLSSEWTSSRSRPEQERVSA